MNDQLYNCIGQHITVVFPNGMGRLTGVYLTCHDAAKDIYSLHFLPGITMEVAGKNLKFQSVQIRIGEDDGKVFQLIR